MALAATMSPENSLADQSCTGRNEIMTLRFAEIQQELKVAAAECRAASDYKRFVHAYKPALDLSDQAMLSVFRDNSVGDTGTSAYAAFKAQLVSNSLLRSARNKSAFCGEARSEFSAALSGRGALESLISSSQPYVDIPFKDCAEAPSSFAPIDAQQAAPPAVGRQQVQVAGANIAQAPVAPLEIRPDPWAETAPVAPSPVAPDLVRVVPHHAPLVPAIPQLSRPAAAAQAAPQFDVAAPPPIAFARVVPHDVPVVPAVPPMTRPAAAAAAAPQFEVAAPPPVMFARVVPHHAPFVPSVPALTAPAPHFAAAPRFAIAAATDTIVIARVVPHHARFTPAVPRLTAPQEQVAAAPHFAIAREMPPVAVARVEEPVIVRHVVPRHSALRQAGLVLSHPRASSVEAPQVEVASSEPQMAAPMRREASDSSIARGLARLSTLAAAMLKREAAADAAESSAPTPPMVAAVRSAPHQANTGVAQVTGDDLAIAAGRAADILRGEPDPHPERRVAARHPVNMGTTHRRMVAATLVVPAKRGIPLSSLNPTIEVSRVDQVAVVPAHTVHAADPAMAQSATNDQSAVAVVARADVGTPKLGHGFASAKATTYGRAPKPMAGNANSGETGNPPVVQTVPDAPSAALMPQDSNPDQDQNQTRGSDQNGDQQSAPSGNQDDQYGPAYAYDDGYSRARARARAWRRRIIDAYETYRRRSVPDDYSGDYPPPPPWRSDSGSDSWSDQ